MPGPNGTADIGCVVAVVVFVVVVVVVVEVVVVVVVVRTDDMTHVFVDTHQ